MSRDVLGWIAPWSSRGAKGSWMRSFSVATQREQTRAMRPSRMTLERRYTGVGRPQQSQTSIIAIAIDIATRSLG